MALPPRFQALLDWERRTASSRVSVEIVKRLTKQRSTIGPVELRIVGLGALGDGIGRLDGRPVYVPLALPGERALVVIEGERGDGLAGRMTDLRQAASERVVAPCPQFGRCGGCALQHLAESSYVEWKGAQLRATLSRLNLGPVEIRPMQRVGAGKRRRATLAAERAGPAVRVGFNARASRRVVDAAGCQVLAPQLMSVLPALQALLVAILPEGGQADIAMTSCESGVDVAVTTRVALSLRVREALAETAERADLARLTWQGEPVAIRRTPRITFGGVAVDLPPAAFLQPTAEGESALVAAVTGWLAGSKTVADLYSGCGTFTFPLARGARVFAAEGDQSALGALAAAAKRAGLPQITAMQRDLARDPLTADELERFDGVVFDPPRAGARAQAEQLARSIVPTVVAVSCDPATFARDARILVDGGYRFEEVRPIDQFVWSPHLELAALFQR